MKPKYVLIITVLLLFLAVMPLTAQISLVDQTTFSLFGNDVDNFMDPNDYGKVEFGSFFSMLQHDTFFGDHINPLYGGGTNIVSAGFAKKFDDLYTGFYFTGNLFEKNGDNSLFHNYLEALIGSPSFGGIKAGFGFQAVSNGTDYSVFTIMAGWGKNFGLDNGTVLKPEANAILIMPSSKGSATYPGFPPFASVPPAKTIFGIDLKLDWVLLPKGGAEREWEFGYSLGLANIEASPDDYMTFLHSLYASYSQVHTITEKFSAGFDCGLNVFITSMSREISGTTYKSSAFIMVPVAGSAFAYKINQLFSINAGLGINYVVGRSSSSSGSSSSSSSFWNGFEVETSAGGSFEPTSGLAVDFSWNKSGYYNSDIGTFNIGVRFKK